MRGTSVRRIGLASAGLASLLFGTFAMAPVSASTAGGGGSTPPPKPACVVHSLPSFVDQGEGQGEGGTASSVADVIQVECKPVYAEDTVTVYSTELYNACADSLSWLPYPYSYGNFTSGSSVETTLDDDGNATVVAWGGPSCAPTTVDIFASLDAPPYPTAQTTFKIAPPHQTKSGVFALPASEVEDATYSSIATIVQVEFPSAYGGQTVDVDSQELYDRCAYSDSVWIGPDEAYLNGGNASPSVSLTLDNDGNAFAVFVGGYCSSGPSTIEASLTIAPYTTKTTTFTVLSPRPTD